MEHDRRAWMMAEFTKRYGTAPTIWTRAPGRVDLMGSHTDYNQGFILTMTIDCDTWVAAQPRTDRQVRIASLNVAGESTFALDAIDHDAQHPWTDYVRGMAQIMQDAGYRFPGFDALVHTTVPVASGLSSSAAIEMATGRLLETLASAEIDAVQLAILGQRAENTFVGVNCGILDQYTSSVGQAGCALLLDARTLESWLAPMAPGIAVVICDTRAKRELTGSEYGARRAACEEGAQRLGAIYPGVVALRDVKPAQLEAVVETLPAEVAKRCRFIVAENERVLQMAEALTKGDRDAIGALAMASFAGARDLYEITIPEMQIMMAAMMAAPGVIGARQAGAGFGGCLVAFVEAASVPAFATSVEDAYVAATGVLPRVFPVAAAAGAGGISLPA